MIRHSGSTNEDAGRARIFRISLACQRDKMNCFI
jgi:hypothetical protein